MADDADDNVVILDVETSLDIPVEPVIEGLADTEYETILVIGYSAKDGYEFRSSTIDIGRLLLLLERTKQRLLNRPVCIQKTSNE